MKKRKNRVLMHQLKSKNTKNCKKNFRISEKNLVMKSYKSCPFKDNATSSKK